MPVTPADRDYHVARIASGTFLCRLPGRDLVAGTPTRHDRYLAAEVHRQALREAGRAGVLSLAESREVLVDRGLLEPDHEDAHARWLADLRKLKVSLYENYSSVEARGAIRRALEGGRGEFAGLCSRRDHLAAMTGEALAGVARARFLVGCSLRNPDGSPLWPDPWSDYGRPDDAVDAAMGRMAEARLDEAEVRELAREEPWASLWASARHAGGGAFGAASADLTDEQRGLLLWARNYDAIAEHPGCPPEAVVADDDALDGWLTLQQKERESERARTRLDEVRSGKIKDAHEVFLVGADAQEREAIERLNTPAAASQKRQRLAHLKQHTRVSEMQMPDTFSRYQQAAAQAISQSIKGRR